MTHNWLQNIFAQKTAAIPVAAPRVFKPDHVVWPKRKAEEAPGYTHLTLGQQRHVERLLGELRATPTGRVALAWAEAHGIRYGITKSPEDAGSYSPGTGTVYLRHDWLFKSSSAHLVHEIRHMWQDYYGLIPRLKLEERLTMDMGRQLIQQALIEADATAHEALFREELRGRVHSGEAAKIFLTAAFTRWFGSYAPAYHLNALVRLRMADAMREFNEKYPDPPFLSGDDNHVHAEGLDPWRQHEVDKLGRSFSGVNYLSGMSDISRDNMRKTVLTPHAAFTVFNQRSMRRELRAMTHDARKKVIRARLKTPLKRLPLPGVAA